MEKIVLSWEEECESIARYSSLLFFIYIHSYKANELDYKLLITRCVKKVVKQKLCATERDIEYNNRVLQLCFVIEI